MQYFLFFLNTLTQNSLPCLSNNLTRSGNAKAWQTHNFISKLLCFFLCEVHDWNFLAGDGKISQELRVRNLSNQKLKQTFWPRDLIL